MCIGNDVVTIHGALLCMLGDTPASNFIAGFKEGVGFSLRKCRMCMATAEDVKTKAYTVIQFQYKDECLLYVLSVI